MTSTAPMQQALTVECGADYEALISLVDASNNPINVATPRMDIRAAGYSTSALVISPDLSTSANTVTVTITGTATKAMTGRVASYDLFATRTDTGQEVKLAYGSVTFVPAVTQL